MVSNGWMQRGCCRWDIVQAHGGCGVLLFNVDRHAFVLVRQFRPPVHWVNLQRNPAGHPPPHPRNAFTLEVCAGLADKPGLTGVEIVREEILEECGCAGVVVVAAALRSSLRLAAATFADETPVLSRYAVPAASIELVNTIRANVGLLGCHMHYYYCEVRDAQRVGAGGGLADEDIEVVHMPVDEALRVLSNPDLPKTSSILCVPRRRRASVLPSVHAPPPPAAFVRRFLVEWWFRRRDPRRTHGEADATANTPSHTGAVSQHAQPRRDSPGACRSEPWVLPRVAQIAKWGVAATVAGLAVWLVGRRVSWRGPGGAGVNESRWPWKRASRLSR